MPDFPTRQFWPLTTKLDLTTIGGSIIHSTIDCSPFHFHEIVHSIDLVAYLLEKEKHGGAQRTEDKLFVFSYPITRINTLHCFACFYQQIETCDIKISSLQFHPFIIKLVDITSYHLRAEIKVPWN